MVGGSVVRGAAQRRSSPETGRDRPAAVMHYDVVADEVEEPTLTDVAAADLVERNFRRRLLPSTVGLFLVMGLVLGLVNGHVVRYALIGLLGGVVAISYFRVVVRHLARELRTGDVSSPRDPTAGPPAR